MVTQKVAAILGESATGLKNTFDGDAIDTSTPEREKFIVHAEDITDADELNQVSPDYFNLQVEIQNLSTRDGWLTRWFYKKCKDERSWC
ncbi:uncharacterized protein LOC105221799 isoform X4 [Bactrocera dorsalis]|uniref:Uncharacterized protein LOC105221799 isoform X4 n=1 Tax=Bactrocera dorsalis TaxID=27457 RepID=A0ABM3J414_BACDO|nr:uncharacterized protein LOC105221799 isoform X4 [Bactrocera dorsalis]